MSLIIIILSVIYFLENQPVLWSKILIQFIPISLNKSNSIIDKQNCMALCILLNFELKLVFHRHSRTCMYIKTFSWCYIKVPMAYKLPNDWIAEACLEIKSAPVFKAKERVRIYFCKFKITRRYQKSAESSCWKLLVSQ